MGRITAGERAGFLDGSADYWVDELTRLSQDFQMDTFIFAPQEPSEAQIRRFAEEVAPRVP
jgi:hypothetical protein